VRAGGRKTGRYQETIQSAKGKAFRLTLTGGGDGEQCSEQPSSSLKGTWSQETGGEHFGRLIKEPKGRRKGTSGGFSLWECFCRKVGYLVSRKNLSTKVRLIELEKGAINPKEKTGEITEASHRKEEQVLGAGRHKGGFVIFFCISSASVRSKGCNERTGTLEWSPNEGTWVKPKSRFMLGKKGKR